MDIMYNVFKTEDPRAILDYLVVGDAGDTGFRLASSMYNQHFKVDPEIRIQLEPDEVRDMLDRELAWFFFRDHGADHASLNREIETLIKKLKTDYDKAIDAYANWIYENASARVRLDSPL